ncbi:MAG: M42 family peptidase [Anaerolineae bacterium]
MIDVLKLLRELSEAPGVSGYESPVCAIAQAALSPVADTLSTDALGNLIAIKRGTQAGEPRRSIMLAAHMDEIGLIVSAQEGSFLRFATVGGVDLRTVVGQEVTVHGCRDLPGIIASRPPHVLTPEERAQPVPLDKLYIDTGLSEQALQQAVQVGDLVTMRRRVTELAGGYVSGKAMDDRAGVVSLAVCLDTLKTMTHFWDVYAVITTQEEVGLKGAGVSAYRVAPDLGVAVDVGFGRQPGLPETRVIDMDGGPAVAMGPNIHPAFRARLMDLAHRLEFKVQSEVMAGASGTDGWAIQVAREGVPTLVLSIPLRYMHTSVETVCLRDIERTGRLLAHLIADLDEHAAAELLGAEGAPA